MSNTNNPANKRAVMFFISAILLIVLLIAFVLYAAFGLSNEKLQRGVYDTGILAQKYSVLCQYAEDAAESIYQAPEASIEKMKQLLLELKDRNDFSAVYYTDNSGITSDEKAENIITPNSNIQALVSEGKPGIFNDDDGIMISVPIFFEGKYCGAITAKLDKKEYNVLSNADNIFISDSMGNYLSGMVNNNKIGNLIEFYRQNAKNPSVSYEEISRNIQSGNAGYATFNIDGNPYYAMYSPVIGQNFCIVFTTKGSISGNSYSIILGIALLLAAFAFIVFCAIIILKMGNANAKQNKRTEKIEKVYAEQNSVLYRISHELRNPLNAIVGTCSLMRQSIQNTEKISDCLAKISYSSKLILNSLNDIIETAEVSNRKYNLSNTRFSLKDVVNNITSVNYEACRGKEITFSEILGQDIPEILVGDGVRLNQILQAIMSNAIKYTKTGGSVRLSISSDKTKSNNEIIVFTIADTGIGMDKNTLDSLFNTTIKESDENKLTGLRVAKRYAELMGGSIHCESTKNIGTKIVVRIPFTIIEEKQIINENRKSIKVLLADNDIRTLEYIKTSFDALGITCDAADNSATVIELLDKAIKSNTPYDLCLVDYCIKGTDVFSITEYIRNELSDEKMKIAVMSYNLFEIDDTILHIGVNKLIAKPLFISSLEELIMNLFEGKTSPAARLSDYSFSGKKILIAEDNMLNREMVREILQVVGLNATAVENGKQAVDVLAKSKDFEYSAILMDVQMPVMDGLEATRQIRAMNRRYTKNIPIIAMTGNAFAEDVANSRSAGMDAHITKPVDVDFMISVLSSCIE